MNNKIIKEIFKEFMENMNGITNLEKSK